MLHTHEAIDMMRHCEREIVSQRELIALLRPKAEAYDTLRQVLNLLPLPSQSFGVDLVWQLRKAIEEQEAQITPAAPAVSNPEIET